MLAIDDPPIGARDFRGIELSGPLPTHFRAGEVTRVSGHVTASDTVDFNQALIFFQPFEASTSDSTVRASGAISRTGDFTLSVRFTDSQKGRYIVGIALFWPNSGSQYARTYLTPVVVD